MRLGIDVGGTNTDAVILSESGTLLGAAKALTTPDILGGIRLSVEKLQQAVPLSVSCPTLKQMLTLVS